MEKKKLKKIVINSTSEIKIISTGQQRFLVGGSSGCACCICSPGNSSSGTGGSEKASRQH